MKFKFLKATFAIMFMMMCNVSNAGLITLDFSGTSALDSNDYYLASITFDDTVAGNSGSNTLLGITDFQLVTFGSIQTSFDFGDITPFFWNYAFSNDLASQLNGFIGQAWIAIGAENDDGYSMTHSNYITQDLYLNGGIVVTYTNDVIGTRPALNAAPVPEPSTLAIFALGMVGLVLRRAKKQY